MDLDKGGLATRRVVLGDIISTALRKATALLRLKHSPQLISHELEY